MPKNFKFFAAMGVVLMFAGFSAGAMADCKASYNSKYGPARGHKAFAMTAPGSVLSLDKVDKGYACGWYLNQPTRALAIRGAMTHCESARVIQDRRGSCRIVKSE